MASYCDNMKAVKCLYYLASKPIDLDNFEANRVVCDDYGRGIYLFPNPNDAMLFGGMQTLGDNKDTPYKLYQYSFDSNDVDFSRMEEKHWMYRLIKTEREQQLLMAFLDKNNWNNKLISSSEFVPNDIDGSGNLINGFCELTCGPIYDECFRKILCGQDTFDVDVNQQCKNIQEHFSNLIELPADTRIEFCFHTQEALRRLTYDSIKEDFENRIILNLRIGEIR